MLNKVFLCLILKASNNDIEHHIVNIGQIIQAFCCEIETVLLKS